MTSDDANQRLQAMGRSRYWLAHRVHQAGGPTVQAVYHFLRGEYKRPSYELIASIDRVLRDEEKNSQHGVDDKV